MAFDAVLASRMRAALSARRDISEKQMFGGLCFLAHGNMAFGIVGNELMLRVGPHGYEAALAMPHARVMDFTGKISPNMVYVAPLGFASDPGLAAWLKRALAFADTLPAKAVKPAKRKQAPARSSKAAKPAKAPAAAFTGFPKKAFAFLRGIAADNSKAHFQAHQDGYHALYDAGVQLATSLGPELKAVSPKLHGDPRINGSVFRIQRDIRFSKDKTPYKNHLDLWFWTGNQKGWNNPGCFFRMFPRRLILGAGMHRFEKDQLERFRKAVVGEKSGKPLAALLRKLEKAGYVTAEPVRKQVPRGFDPEHPRAQLLLLEGLHMSYDGPVPKEASGAKFVDFCVKQFRATWPVCDWLLHHVVK